MTAIAGIISEGKVYLGTDGMISREDGFYSLTNVPKICVKGDFIIGCAGLLRFSQIIRHAFVPPKVKKDLDSYMCSSFSAAMRKCLAEHEFKDDDELGVELLIGTQGKLFWMGKDGSAVQSTREYAAIGSGAFYSIGSLFTTAKVLGMTPEERLIEALEAAVEHDCYVKPPFTILSL